MIREIRSHFPAYYNKTAWIALGLALIINVVFDFAQDRFVPSWLVLAPGILVYLIVGHGFAFILDFIRGRMNKAKPGDVAKPVAYYTPDMAPGSYQPTFLKVSTLIKFGIFLGVISAIILIIDMGGSLAPTWDKINQALNIFYWVGFIFGCREIARASKEARS